MSQLEYNIKASKKKVTQPHVFKSLFRNIYQRYKIACYEIDKIHKKEINLNIQCIIVDYELFMYLQSINEIIDSEVHPLQYSQINENLEVIGKAI